MAYRWVDHTAELELRLECGTQEAIFEDALQALADLLHDGTARDHVAFDVTLSATDRATLLAHWLDELVFRAETEDLVPESIERLALDERGLKARVRGHRGEPRHIVKGVTYHRLGLEETGEGRYRATVVLDV